MVSKCAEATAQDERPFCDILKNMVRLYDDTLTVRGSNLTDINIIVVSHPSAILVGSGHLVRNKFYKLNFHLIIFYFNWI